MSVRIMALVFGSDLPPIDRLVALALADHAHDDGTRVWPSVPSTAAKVGLGTTATREALRRLEATGVVEMVSAKPGKTREYRFVPGWMIGQMTPTSAVGVEADDEDMTPTSEGGDPNVSRGGPQPVSVAEPSTTEPSTPEPSGTALAKATNVPVIPSPFDAFWSVYPAEGRREKPRARLKFAKAAERAPVTTIIAGAVRYRDDPNREPRYTKHAATWLHNDCWEDPALTPRGKRDVGAELMQAAVDAGYDGG